jgi:hypothetical protein
MTDEYEPGEATGSEIESKDIWKILFDFHDQYECRPKILVMDIRKLVQVLEVRKQIMLLFNECQHDYSIGVELERLFGKDVSIEIISDYFGVPSAYYNRLRWIINNTDGFCVIEQADGKLRISFTISDVYFELQEE